MLIMILSFSPDWLSKDNKANLRDLIAATSLVILLKFDPNHRFFSPCDLEIWCKKIRGHLFYTTSSFVYHCKSIGEFKLKLQSRNAQFGSKSAIFCSVWDWNWWMTLENNRAPLLYYIKLCASLQIHQWIQIGVTVWKRPIRVKIGDFLSCVTLKFDGWRWKTIGYLFYTTPSFVQHFVAIGEFKLELQSGNAQFGSNSTIFRAVQPWNLTEDLEKQ